MSEQDKIKELSEENQKLKERVVFLERTLSRGKSGNTSAYNQIRTMIVQKVEKEVEIDIVSGQERDWTRKVAEKKIMSDLKWDLRVRVIADFSMEHVKLAEEYLNNYILPEEYKKSRWNYKEEKYNAV